MDTRNTIKHKSTSQLDRAIFTLEILCHEQSIPILDYLQEHDQATFLDLTLHTGFDSVMLEMQLESLCLTRVLVQHENVFGCHYALDPDRLYRVSRIAARLAAFRRDD